METIHRPVVGDAEFELTVARFLISQPKNWCKGRFGGECGGGGPFCAGGAIRHLWFQRPVRYRPWTSEKPAELLAVAAGLPNIAEITVWNDNPDTTHAMVLAAFDAAIAEAKARGI